MHRLLPLVLAGALLPACSATSSPPPVEVSDGPPDVLAELRAEVGTVSELQAEADRTLNDVLDVVRRVDEAVAALERVSTVDDQLASYDEVHQQVETTGVDDLRTGYIDTAEAVDEARDLVAGARQQLDDDWSARYLDAQDAVLVEVREYAEAADRVAQLVQEHWPTYVEVDGRVAAFVDGRSDYRDAEEARDALALELDPVIDDLVVAERQIARYGRQRRTAGEAVNAASDRATSVYDQRPEPATGAPDGA